MVAYNAARHMSFHFHSFKLSDAAAITSISIPRAKMSAGQAKLESRPRTDWLFYVSDRVRITILKSELDSGSPKLHCHRVNLSIDWV